MAMKSVYEMAKTYYPQLWDKARLERLVEAGKLTIEQMDEIIEAKSSKIAQN